MRFFAKYISLFIAGFSLVSCNLNQEIEIDLPEYTPQVVVECYVENGKQMQLLLTESSSYFDAFVLDPVEYIAQILVNDATISINVGGTDYEMENGLFLDPLSLRFNNYSSADIIDVEPGTEMSLDITLADGTKLSAQSTMIAPFEIDSVAVEFSPTQPDNARTLIFGTDTDAEINYFRRMLHKTSRDSVALIDFVASDEFNNGDEILFGSNYDFERGDTCINTLIHITKDYYDFYQSVQGAAFVNGNPFAQPGQFISNISGDNNPIGVFTSISVDTTFTIIPD